MKVSLFYCNICNIACEHCFLDKSLPECRMEDDLFMKVLQEIYQVNGDIGLISISGGEPMLFFDDIMRLIERCNINHELTFSISTNAFWATSKEISENICKRLIMSGVQRLEISYDKFHAKFIDINNIYNAVEACKKYGIVTYVVFSIANGYDYLPLYIKLNKFIDKKHVILQHVANYGNARLYGVNCMMPINIFEGKKCSQILNPCIDYDANFYACCGANILSQSSPMLVGNLKDSSFVTLVNKMKSSILYQQILNDGPLQLNQAYNSDKVCSSLCELCDNLK